MAYFGKEFVLNRQENFDAFVNSLKVGTLNDQHRQALIADKPSVKLVKSGDGYTLYNARSDGVKEIKFTPGVEFDEVLAGNKAKSTISVNGNVFTHVMKFPEGAITISRAFSDNELVTTFTTADWDGKAVRYYSS